MAKKETNEEHDEATRVLVAALLDGRKMKAALNHPLVGPIVKKLGPKAMSQLSQIAKTQSVCPPCPSNA
jgi:hypothetical protein